MAASTSCSSSRRVILRDARAEAIGKIAPSNSTLATPLIPSPNAPRGHQ